MKSYKKFLAVFLFCTSGFVVGQASKVSFHAPTVANEIDQIMRAAVKNNPGEYFISDFKHYLDQLQIPFTRNIRSEVAKWRSAISQKAGEEVEILGCKKFNIKMIRENRSRKLGPQQWEDVKRLLENRGYGFAELWNGGTEFCYITEENFERLPEIVSSDVTVTEEDEREVERLAKEFEEGVHISGKPGKCCKIVTITTVAAAIGGVVVYFFVPEAQDFVNDTVQNVNWTQVIEVGRNASQIVLDGIAGRAGWALDLMFN